MKKVIEEAIAASENSYSPYSNYRVGAAILMKDGVIVTGTNVENASYGLTNCAERTALYTATTMGYTRDDIVEMAVVAGEETIGSPCGACRQVMSELVPMDATIYMSNLKGKNIETTMKELLPFAFNSSDLTGDLNE